MNNIVVINQKNNTVLADQCQLARTFLARGMGLMGRSQLEPGHGLIIYPEWSIHTFFMRFPIDVVFLDRNDHVVGKRSAMPPNRPYAGVWGARYVIELPAGVLEATATEIGDRLEVTPSPHTK